MSDYIEKEFADIVEEEIEDEVEVEVEQPRRYGCEYMTLAMSVAAGTPAAAAVQLCDELARRIGDGYEEPRPGDGQDYPWESEPDLLSPVVDDGTSIQIWAIVYSRPADPQAENIWDVETGWTLIELVPAAEYGDVETRRSIENYDPLTVDDE